MANYKRQSGISLTEILVVIAVIALLMGVSIPAAKQLANSFEETAGVRHLINAALSNARAIAVREQAYAGVRFQENKDGNGYIIFIQHDPAATGLANGFRAVNGRKPMKLPEDVGVLSYGAYTDTDLATSEKLNDAKTFSIVFSPQGKLTIHRVRIRNKDGYDDSDASLSNDTIFNIQALVEPPNESSMFYQDDYGPDLGLKEEDSVQSLYVFSKSELKSVPNTLRWTNYFTTLEPDYINPYTGELILE